MDAVASWAIAICICAAAGLLLELMAPSGSMDKILRFVLGAFMLCAVLFPAGNMVQGINRQIQSIDFDSSTNTQFSKEVEEQSQQVAKASVISLVDACMEKTGAKAEKIELTMDSDEDGRISIILVTVSIKPEYKEQQLKIKTAIEEELGLDTKIKIVESGNLAG